MFQRSVSRRTLLKNSARAVASLSALAVVGCGSEQEPANTPGPPSSAAATKTLAATPAPATKAWTWVPVPTSAGPAARRDHSLTFNPDDGLLYLFGGRAAGVSDNQLWTFDTQSREWQELPASGTGPAPRFGHNAAYDAARKRLVIALGQGNGTDFFNDVWAYDGTTWAQIDAGDGDRPATRYGSASALDDAAQLIVSHGFTDSGRFDDTWTNDIATGKWVKHATSGPVPIKRCLARGVWLPERRSFLMFGGQTDTNPFLGDQWTLDVRTSMWTEEKPTQLPGPRNLYGASTSSDSAVWYIVGGNTAAGPSDEAWAYDLGAGEWTQVLAKGSAPAARYSTDAAFVGDGLYMFGGHDGTSETDDLWLLDSQVVVAGAT